MDTYNRYNPVGPCSSYVACASTGKAAAALVGGTLPSVCELSSKWGDVGLRYRDLNTFRVAFRYVKCVIIYEVNKMSSDQVRTVDYHLRQISQCLDESMGDTTSPSAASAVAIHKSQGGTHPTVVYKYSNTHSKKLVYVALSRSSNIENLYLKKADGDHTSHHRRRNEDGALMNEFKHLEEHMFVSIEGRFLRAYEENVERSGE
ncbi:hypothetical protein HPB52_022973 [Rhipicephalus sanguineus]|uniref:UvrD-like helicase C-terminal domain-containing protein n=1 Tax=Rhipicephalus sanguineus TaxID=34632 RepID=A0A9D4ST12_RHISA|nr:hypothetical protein HPB52_022973 [Rhipicephalus sanguineus]